MDRRLALAEWAASFRARFGLSAEAEAWLVAQLLDRATPAHFAVVRNRFGLVESAGTLWERYCADIAAAVVCPSEVLAGLEELRAAGWRVGVATNGAAGIQRAKLCTAGIVERVDAVCVSDEVSQRKSDPALFHEAIRRCGGHRRDSPGWMVGDNPVNDIEGGRGAGLRTIWISHGAAWPRKLPEPDHTAPNVGAAIDLLAALEPMRSIR